MLEPVALQDLKQNFRGELLTSTDAEYDGARTIWNGMIDRRPALIVILIYPFKSAACELPARPGGHAFLMQANIPASRVQAAAIRSDRRRDSQAT